MGPDGNNIMMDYGTTKQPPADPYIPPQPYPPAGRPPHFPQDGDPYNPAMVQDPYGYTRAGTIPSDPAGKINHS